MPKQITEVSPAGDSLPGLHTPGNPQLSPLDRTSAFLTRSSGTIMHFVLDHCAKCFVCTHLHQCSRQDFSPTSHEACENEETLQLLDAGARPTKHTIISAADPNELNVHSQASKLKGICTPCTVLLCCAVCLFACVQGDVKVT